jgi:hypothetical protein
MTVLLYAVDYEAVKRTAGRLGAMSINHRLDEAQYLLKQLQALIGSGLKVDDEVIQLRYNLNLVIAGAKEWQATQKPGAFYPATRNTTSSLPVG